MPKVRQRQCIVLETDVHVLRKLTVLTQMFSYLYYGFEACPLSKSQIHSLEFALNSCLRKYSTLVRWRL